jgi:hypothetical protein
MVSLRSTDTLHGSKRYAAGQATVGGIALEGMTEST